MTQPRKHTHTQGKPSYPELLAQLQQLVRDNPDQSRLALAWKLEIERRLGQMDATLGNYATGGLPSASRWPAQRRGRSRLQRATRARSFSRSGLPQAGS